MKFLDPTQATDTAQQPVKNGTLQFLQDAHKENTASVIQAMLGSAYNTSNIYALWGCTEQGSIVSGQLVSQFQPGSLFYNGEVFDFAGGTVTLPGETIQVFTIVTTQYMPASPLQADPVVFTDGSSRNVHNVRTVQVSAGPAGGAGIANYIGDINALQYPQLVLATEITNRTNADNALQASLTNQVSTINTSITTETNARTAADTTLQNNINAIGTGWIQVPATSLTLHTQGGGGGNMTATSGTLCYIITGNTITLTWNFTCTFSSTPANALIVLPGNAAWHPGFAGLNIGYFDAYPSHCCGIATSVTSGGDSVLLIGGLATGDGIAANTSYILQGQFTGQIV